MYMYGINWKYRLQSMEIQTLIYNFYKQFQKKVINWKEKILQDAKSSIIIETLQGGM